MHIYRWLLVTLILLVCAGAASAQRRPSERYRNRETRSSTEYEAPRRLIDSPTAGTLRRGSFDVDMRMYPEGGLLTMLQLGLFDAFDLGMSYGATRMIAQGDPKWNPDVEFELKLQLVRETFGLPAISVGFSSQGHGPWVEYLQRYQGKSKGFYAVGSKGYRGQNFESSLHGGVNLSLEDDIDQDDTPNFFFGFEAKFENDFGLLAEWDMGLNDDREGTTPDGRPLTLSKGHGYVNVGLRWIFLERLSIEADLKNLLDNRVGSHSFGREIRIIYLESLR